MSLASFASYLADGWHQLDAAPFVPIIGHGPTRPRWIALLELAERERVTP